jgi:hypothetical protein
VGLNVNLFTPAVRGADVARPAGTFPCPGCSGDVSPMPTETGWQVCPYCDRRLQAQLWAPIRRNGSAAVAMADQATCFFHPDKAFQACCQQCGRFVCGLCDLQLGSEHVCPTCFERGRTSSRATGGPAEWRHRDVLYDSISLSLGWAWIIVWPVVIVALPAAIVLHIKYRKAPRSYLIPRSGWRFWLAYAGFAWLPLLLTAAIWLPRLFGRH